MENLKNKFIFLLMLMFMISFVSAFEIDNVKSYDEKTKTITIKNSFLGIPLGKVAEIKLNTPLNFKVPRGYQKVAEFEIKNFEDYTNALKQLQLFDLKRNNKEFLRDFDYKYKTYINVSVNDYENVIISTLKNGTNIYEQQLIGSHLELREKWINLNSKDFKKNDILTIGIFIDVKKGDRVEWIPTFYGKEILEWAVWSESLNTNLISYYKLNETSGTNATDSRDGNHGINNGATVNVVGKIGTAYDFDSSVPDYISFGTTPFDWDLRSQAITISSWVKFTGISSAMTIISKEDQDSPYTGWEFGYGSGNGGRAYFGYLDTAIKGVTVRATSLGLSTGQFYHIVVTYDGSGTAAGFTIYVNGTSQTLTTVQDDSTGTTINSIDARMGLRDTSNSPFNGVIDEVGIWERELSSDEVSDLFNNFTGITYTDVFGPIVTLNSPIDTFNSTNQTIKFNGSVTSTVGIINVSLIIDGVYNETNTSGTNNIDYLFTKTIADGNHNWTYESCDIDGCTNATVRTFTLDSTSPQINITFPIGLLDFNSVGQNETLNVTFTDVNLDTCWYDYNGTNVTIPGCLTGVLNSTNFTLETGNLNLTAYSNDSVGNENSSFNSWSYKVLELNQTFEENITEGELNIFSLLLDTSGSLDDSVFSYNGTNYTATVVFSSGLYLISSSIISPTVDANTNFSFNFFFTVDDVNYSTIPNQQLVLNSLFSICGGISNDTLLNISLVDEETELSILGTIEIVASIVSKSSGVSVGTINNAFENVSSGAICFSPISSYPLYYLDTEIRYSSDGYVPELYYIQNSDVIDYPKNLTLYDLNQSDSTEFVITFQDDSFIFVEGAIVQLQRKYIGENLYKVVEAPITADGGKAIVHIDLNTNIYRISIVKDGVLLKFFEDIVFDCQNELAGDCEEQLLGDVNPNNDIPVGDITDFAYSVSVSDVNNTVNVLFTIPSGTPSNVNVLLEQRDMFGNVTSCNTTVVTSAGSITCGFNDTIEKSILQLTISKDGTEMAITNYGVDPKLDMDGMNFFIVFLFLISLVGMAIASPEWTMIIGIMVFMISGTLLLLSGMSLAMGLGAMAWLVVAVIIIILKMAKQEDR